MVVASIALLVALAGTSVAAVTSLPSNSVGTAQLQRNAVISSKVDNGSLLTVDFAPGQLPRGRRGPQGPQGPQGVSGPSGPAGVASPGYIAQAFSQTGNASSTTTSTTYVDLPASSQTVTVPAGQTAKLLVYFSAESACYGGVGAQYCGVRVTVDGAELRPTSSNFAFDSNENATANTNYRASHAIARVSDTLAAGSHTVKVQYRTSSGSTSLRLDNWAMVVEVQRLT